MILSTQRFRFLGSLAAALSVVLVALVLSHVALEALARWAESKPHYYLWAVDDHLMLFNQSRMAGRHASADRMVVFGGSEAGEGIVDEVLERGLPGMSVEHISIDGGMFHDAVLQLKYIEQVYGKSALPSHVLIGLSPRLVANVPVDKFGERLTEGVNRFSPAVSVNNSGALPRLVPKTRLRAIAAWVNLQIVQTERYRAAMNALILEVDSRLHPGRPPRASLLEAFQKAKTRHRIRSSDDVLKSVLTERGHWQITHAWRASEHRDSVDREFAYLEAFARRNGLHLYYVNLPEWPINKQMFEPGVYDDYLQTVRRASGANPFLDLGDLLSSSEFVDAVHPTAAGADRESAAIADFVRENTSQAPAGKTVSQAPAASISEGSQQ